MCAVVLCAHTCGRLCAAVATPDVVTADFRVGLRALVQHRNALSLPALPGLGHVDDVAFWRLYSARHGGICQHLVDGDLLVERLSMLARVPLMTILRHSLPSA